jgi:hypothetical protein
MAITVTERVVERPKKLPPRLRELAAENGYEDPGAYLASLIERYPVFEDAAIEAGVCRLTLYRWRRRLGIRVA